MRSASSSRRQFLKSAASSAVAVVAAPAIATASRTFSEIILGDGDHRFRVHHAYPQLPDNYSWQTTHNVALDKAGNLYVIHEGRADLKDHPSIFVFDAEGKFIRAFGNQFQGGGHGIEVRDEGGEEFLYVAAYQQVKAFAKLSLKGDVVWTKHAPMESGVYAEGEDTNPQKVWGADRFLPTNFAFLDDGGFLLADGYGSCKIHRYDKDAKWLSCFGGVGDGKGTFKTAHGLWVDRREGREPSIVVTDRAHNTLQTFDMEGNYQETIEGFGLPANIDTWKNLMLVPELKARVTLLDEKNQVVAQLGTAIDRLNEIQGLRTKPDQWINGQFVHPHDACFAPNGDIFVAEWVGTGRVTKLERV
ncbi:MAG: hypothetical protein KDA91_21165 [Planctomycetaceae bacterium]|nr:hypothetical protein [Planctomycetaceae bacterium]